MGGQLKPPEEEAGEGRGGNVETQVPDEEASRAEKTSTLPVMQFPSMLTARIGPNSPSVQYLT